MQDPELQVLRHEMPFLVSLSNDWRECALLGKLLVWVVGVRVVALSRRELPRHVRRLSSVMVMQLRSGMVVVHIGTKLVDLPRQLRRLSVHSCEPRRQVVDHVDLSWRAIRQLLVTVGVGHGLVEIFVLQLLAQDGQI